MPYVSFHLDSGALIALSGLSIAESKTLRSLLERTDSELTVTHIQIDEKHPDTAKDYRKKVQEALAALTTKGLRVTLEPSKVTVANYSRSNLTQVGNQALEEAFGHLVTLLRNCEGVAERDPTPPGIGRDAIIGVSSMDHDVFVTTDKCLSRSYRKLAETDDQVVHAHSIPEIVYVRPVPTKVFRAMTRFLHS